MLTILLEIGGILFGAVGGMVLGLLVKGWFQKSQKSKGVRAGAMMALAFMGMFNVIPPETTTISEPSGDMKVKKGAKPGDPPEPD